MYEDDMFRVSDGGTEEVEEGGTGVTQRRCRGTMDEEEQEEERQYGK